MASTCFAGEWKDTKGGKMFIDNGQAVTGMAEIDGDTYYFNSKGIMKTGWLKNKIRLQILFWKRWHYENWLAESKIK